MMTLQEYDIDIKPSLVVRGQGLCKLAVDSSHFPADNTDVNIDEYFLEIGNLFLSSSTQFLVFRRQNSPQRRK